VPVFVDTLADHATIQRFGEIYGSYPVLRIHDHESKDLAKRLDGNPLRGRIPVDAIVELLADGRRAFERAGD